jgi:hypothetical protein
MRRVSIGKFPRAGPTDSLSIVSRRRFFGTTAAAAGLALGSTLWTPALAEDDNEDQQGQGCPDPHAIPHVNEATVGFGAFHFFFPGHADGSASSTDPTGVHPNGRDPSTLFDFDGFIGQADLILTGMGTDTTTGVSVPYKFHTDMRFATGKFLATDMQVHNGTFAFI